MSKSIAERIEALEGGERTFEGIDELRLFDGRIEFALHGKEGRLYADLRCGGLVARNDCPHYTTSIDAAMTLAPDTTDVTLGRVWCSHRFAHITDGETTWSGKATTEALALCAAALRAQEATNG